MRTGRVWKFGDNINTDLMLPSHVHSGSEAEQMKAVFSANRPGWVDLVQHGDVIVGGRNYGMGSSRPAARSVRNVGIACVIADSINALGFQIAFYYGLAGLACAWHFRKQALSGLTQFVLLFAWPLIGVGFCLYIAVYNLSTYDSLTNLIGVGGIAIGILPYLRTRQLAGGRGR